MLKALMRRLKSSTQFPEGDWGELGADSLPNVPVWDLDYDDTDKVLIAATLGRGAWKLGTGNVFGAPDANALFETVGGTGDMLTLDLNDYAIANSFAINSISMPDVGEVVTMTPNELGLELSVDSEVIGQIVFPENLGGLTFETGGVFHFLPTLSDTKTYDDDSGEHGFQGRLKVNVGAGAFEYSVYFNVAPGYSISGGPFAVSADDSARARCDCNNVSRTWDFPRRMAPCPNRRVSSAEHVHECLAPHGSGHTKQPGLPPLAPCPYSRRPNHAARCGSSLWDE